MLYNLPRGKDKKHLPRAPSIIHSNIKHKPLYIKRVM